MPSTWYIPRGSSLTQPRFARRLIHVTNLETGELRNYHTNSNIASIGATNWYKSWDMLTWELLWLCRVKTYTTELVEHETFSLEVASSSPTLDATVNLKRLTLITVRRENSEPEL